MSKNEIGLAGIEFIEFASPDPGRLHQLFSNLGFCKRKLHKEMKVDYYQQNDIHFLLNQDKGSYAQKFSKMHGPSISSMGWRVRDAKQARAIACKRGAMPCEKGDLFADHGERVPAVYGIGESVIYFIEGHERPDRYERLGFQELSQSEPVQAKGFVRIDHLTNNVQKGTMKQWSDFYKNIFEFTEVRYFDIRGSQTGLKSYALRSPCGQFCIPINEANESKSQINEYLEQYRGPGIQHVAFLTEDILTSLEQLQGSSIATLDIDPEYYDTVFSRVPHVTEDRDKLKKFNVLIDGDDQGYLLQIFTRNLVGPIFIEMIQRKNYESFGEGNFGALFKSIERDQLKRGYL